MICSPVLKIVKINPIKNPKSFINHKICPEIKTIGDYFSFVDNWHQQWKIIIKKKVEKMMKTIKITDEMRTTKATPLIGKLRMILTELFTELSSCTWIFQILLNLFQIIFIFTQIFFCLSSKFILIFKCFIYRLFLREFV